MTLALNEDMCPVSLELLGMLYRAGEEQLDEILDTLDDLTRARLAVYLYGRSHTHELGLKIAAGCEGSTLRRASGLIGNAVYEHSRRPQAGARFGIGCSLPSKKISLGGSTAWSGVRS